MSVLDVKEEDYPIDLDLDESLLQVFYPEIPSFSPTAEDISFFNMISDEMVRSMKETTDIDFQSETFDYYYCLIQNQSSITEEEKEVYVLQFFNEIADVIWNCSDLNMNTNSIKIKMVMMKRPYLHP